MIHFFIPCIPPTTTMAGGSGRRSYLRPDGKIGTFKSAKAREAEDTWIGLFLPHQPAHAYKAPCAVKIALAYPWRKSEPKWRLAQAKAPHTSKPDLDNLAKTLLDVLVKLRYIEDDAGVYKLELSKCWSDQPGIALTIEPYGYEPPALPVGVQVVT